VATRRGARRGERAPTAGDAALEAHGPARTTRQKHTRDADGAPAEELEPARARREPGGDRHVLRAARARRRRWSPDRLILAERHEAHAHPAGDPGHGAQLIGSVGRHARSRHRLPPVTSGSELEHDLTPRIGGGKPAASGERIAEGQRAMGERCGQRGVRRSRRGRRKRGRGKHEQSSGESGEDGTRGDAPAQRAGLRPHGIPPGEIDRAPTELAEGFAAGRPCVSRGLSGRYGRRRGRFTPCRPSPSRSDAPAGGSPARRHIVRRRLGRSNAPM